jgi:hypothetical protein
MIPVELKGTDQKYMWEIVGLYRASYEDVRVIERFAAHTGLLQNSMK